MTVPNDVGVLECFEEVHFSKDTQKTGGGVANSDCEDPTSAKSRGKGGLRSLFLQAYSPKASPLSVCCTSSTVPFPPLPSRLTARTEVSPTSHSENRNPPILKKASKYPGLKVEAGISGVGVGGGVLARECRGLLVRDVVSDNKLK